MLQNGKDVMFSLPLKAGSDSAFVCERELAGDFNANKFLNQMRGAYRSAPHFAETFPLLEEIVRFPDGNLFRFLHHSIDLVKACLGITVPTVVSSTVPIDHDLKSQDKVLAICEALGATTYINPIGGIELYSKDEFGKRNVKLEFIRAKPFEYRQLGNDFVPWLSILDVLMFNSKDAVKTCVENNYELI
jgi:hypothetical protein